MVYVCACVCAFCVCTGIQLQVLFFLACVILCPHRSLTSSCSSLDRFAFLSLLFWGRGKKERVRYFQKEHLSFIDSLSPLISWKVFSVLFPFFRPCLLMNSVSAKVPDEEGFCFSRQSVPYSRSLTFLCLLRTKTRVTKTTRKTKNIQCCLGLFCGFVVVVMFGSVGFFSSECQTPLVLVLSVL